MGRHVHSTSSTGLPAHRAAAAGRPGPRPRTAPAGSHTPAVRADGDVVVIRRLPAVPPTAPQPAVAPGRDVPDASAEDGAVPRPAAHAEGRRAQRAARVRSRRGGRLHGVLVYATGVLLVLSSVYGVAHAVGGGDVVTQTASSFRNWCFGEDGGGAGQRRGQARAVAAGNASRTAPAAPAPVEPVAEAGSAEAEAEVAEAEVADRASGSTESVSTESVSAASGGGASEAPSPADAPSGAVTQDAPVAAGSTGPAGSGTPAARTVLPAGTWLSGASGSGVSDGSFGTWRGRDVEIASTWADNNEAMTELWQLRPGGEYGSWDRSLDIAIGAIGDGETWERAATGAYDGRWRESLTTLRDLWDQRSGTVYIRFAHEMNGNWFDWSVDAGNHQAFIEAWKRFRALQQEVFPASQLVFNVNRESVDSGIDWRETFPGAEYVDVMGVDYYNQYPYAGDAEEWRAGLDDTDGYGAPKGLQRHLDFARSVGLPLSVSEWSGNADEGDSAAYIQGMYEFFSVNAGSGPGQVLYETQYNMTGDGRRFLLFGDTRMPASAEAYRRLW